MNIEFMALLYKNMNPSPICLQLVGHKMGKETNPIERIEEIVLLNILGLAYTNSN